MYINTIFFAFFIKYFLQTTAFLLSHRGSFIFDYLIFFMIIAYQCGAKASHMFPTSGGYKLYIAEDIHVKSILMIINNRIYVIDFPNLHEKD